MTVQQDHFTQVKKRDGRLVPFEQDRITIAIRKALIAGQEGNDGKDAEKISDAVVGELQKKFPAGYVPSIEEIQDVVEETLILQDYAKSAKAYILYRNERMKMREEGRYIPDHVQKLAEESKKSFRNPLGEFVYYRTYSRWIDDEGRRETWIETVDRYMDFMKENMHDALTVDEYAEIRSAILHQEAMPSMRLLQFAGSAARATNVCAYNCSFLAPSSFRDFGEVMYISMCGTGLGFTVESKNVNALPEIKTQTGTKLPAYVVPDSKEGWADALIFGMQTWFDGNDVDFDLSKLRPAGARLKTMGGKSSGPDPLREVLEFARAKILKRQGGKLSTLDAHDIICKIGEIVVAGGVRRSALISLSDLGDY
jgi:ribonucleotide reductase alpha subunit